MAADRASTLYQPQAVEPARQGPGPSARGTRRGLSANDLCRESRGRRARAGWVRAQVEAALQDRQRQLRGSRRRTLHLYRFSDFAMEGAADHQRAGAHQRGIPAADQDPGLAAERGGGAALAVRPPAQRAGYSAPPCWLAGPGHHQRSTGGGIVTTRSTAQLAALMMLKCFSTS